MNTHVLASLVDRRRELMGEMHTLQTRLHQVHADLASLADVIRQYDPDFKVEAIRPKYRRQQTAAELTSISRAVLDTLRRVGDPMTAKAIGDSIMTERGLDKQDRGLVRSMNKRVGMALLYQRTNGLVEQSEADGGGVVWGLVG